MSGQQDPRDKKREEALAALDRVEAESETIVGSTFVRMADRARDHLSAADKDDDDRIEVWGTRIGRGLGVLFAIGLVIYLAVTYL
ncbi:MAG: hypothetical protein Tsb0019_42530 [Roseibium sp.]